MIQTGNPEKHCRRWADIPELIRVIGSLLFVRKLQRALDRFRFCIGGNVPDPKQKKQTPGASGCPLRV
jgi:hypothetical protein